MDPLLIIVMDGIGERRETWGNAVRQAYTPTMAHLRRFHPFTTLQAHGRSVGLPSDADMGNSEVGHNVIGSGQVHDQGAKLVDESLAGCKLFTGDAWRDLTGFVTGNGGRLHLIGLFSDGNVHSHLKHLQALCTGAKAAGIKEAVIHPLFDGRDVPRGSAEKYAADFARFSAEVMSDAFRITMADGGGRMHVTMDRYGADWAMVRRGYDLYVHGKAEHAYKDLESALSDLRRQGHADDQYIPSFVIKDAAGKPVGLIKDGDGVVCFNFRGDRAMEISQALTLDAFDHFERGPLPRIRYAGMMQYDGDLNIPPRYLVAPPQITGTLTERLIERGVRQFACSETQKFGHVTYFWNGNRSGYVDRGLEEYFEIPSSAGPFDRDPWMQAMGITEATIDRMRRRTFDCGRINFANGDMVGHTGDFQATVTAVGVVDFMLGKLMRTARETGHMLLITADHGNADDMYMSKETVPEDELAVQPPAPKTAHSLSPVPLFLYDPKQRFRLRGDAPGAGLGNLAATACGLLGIEPSKNFLPSLLERH